jgi:hypothetical protein
MAASEPIYFLVCVQVQPRIVPLDFISARSDGRISHPHSNSAPPRSVYDLTIEPEQPALLTGRTVSHESLPLSTKGFNSMDLRICEVLFQFNQGVDQALALDASGNFVSTRPKSASI